MEQYIQLLNLPDSFDLDDLKKVYREMVRKFHPDFAKTEAERIKFNEKMKKFNEANERLREYLEKHGRYERKPQQQKEEYTSSCSCDANTQATDADTNQTTDETTCNCSRQTSDFVHKNIYQNKDQDKSIFKVTLIMLIWCFVFTALFFHPTNNQNANTLSDFQQQEAEEEVIEQEDYTENLVNENENNDNNEVVEAPESFEILKQPPSNLASSSLKYQPEALPELPELPDTEKLYNTNAVKKTAAVNENRKRTVSATSTASASSSTSDSTSAVSTQAKTNQSRQKELLDYKSEHLITDTDLGKETPYQVTASNSAVTYANKYISPKITKSWEALNNKPSTDCATFSVYIDLYGKLRYIQITERPNSLAFENTIRDALNMAELPDLYYVNLGGDIKVTYKVSVKDKKLYLQVLKAVNIIW